MQIVDRLIVDLVESLRGQVDIPVIAVVEHLADQVDCHNNRNKHNRNHRGKRAVLELLAALDTPQCALLFLLGGAVMLFLLLCIGSCILCGIFRSSQLLLRIFLQRIGCGHFLGGFGRLLDFFFFAHNRIPPQLQRLRSNTRIVR